VSWLRSLGATAGAMAIVIAMTATPGLARPQAQDQPVSPAELQRLFDSFAVVQAQQFLAMNDEQYAKFLPKFLSLQTARRQALQQRTRVLNMIRKSLNENQPDDVIKDALKQLQEIEDRGAAEARKAQEAVDQVLDVHQQAQFRIFEEQMERRKLELVTRARQTNRANNPNRPNNPNRGR
jgi:hypothetical protein